MATAEKHKTRSRRRYSTEESGKRWWFFNSGRWAGIASGRRKAMKGEQ